MKKFVLFITLSFISTYMTAQEEFTHYYLKIDGSESENFKIDLGIVDYDEEYNPKQRSIESITTLSQLNDSICAALGEDNTSEQLNVLIHGIWGDYSFAWKKWFAI